MHKKSVCRGEIRSIRNPLPLLGTKNNHLQKEELAEEKKKHKQQNHVKPRVRLDEQRKTSKKKQKKPFA